MTRSDCIGPLIRAGIDYDDALALRRISMTLHRWHELECGDGNGCISRRESDGKPFWETPSRHNGPAIADREAGALKRLAKLMAGYPALGFYIQGDPRGAALYILRPGDVPNGCSADGYYSRGLAVYK